MIDRGLARWWLLLALAACSNKQTPTTGGGSGTATAGACDALRGKLEQLYRAEAQQHESKRIDEAVADNVAMVLGDCAKDPAKVAPCVNGAASVKQIEATCLALLDDEGREGDGLRR